MKLVWFSFCFLLLVSYSGCLDVTQELLSAIESNGIDNCDDIFAKCKNICIDKGTTANEYSCSSYYADSKIVYEGKCGCFEPTTTPAPISEEEFHKRMVVLHNQKRDLHKDTLELIGSNSLRDESQAYANHLAFTSIFGHGVPSGENLYFANSTSHAPDGLNAVEVWYGEEAYWDYSLAAPLNGQVTGHFTQVVWANTRKVGCGRGYNGNNVYVVCRYDPPGNYVGQYGVNVHALN